MWCPVIVNNSSSLPEVGGNAAFYFDATDKISMREAIEKVAYNSELRNSLILKGYEQLKKFSWRKTAENTKLLYRSIL